MIKSIFKKQIFVLIPLLCFMLFYPSFAVSGATSNTTKQLQDGKHSSKEVQPSINKMMATIKDLSANSRDNEDNNEKKACKYLKNRFEAYGYKPYIQKFKFYDMNDMFKMETIHSQNLIVVKKNTTKIRKGIIIICAHYDCDQYSDGANDDASGCAVVLETARLLKNIPSGYEYRFILFGSEEYGCKGSLQYVDTLSKDEINNVKAVIDIDSIAQKNYVKPRIFTVGGKKNTATALLKHAKENKKLTINIMKREQSDYAVFDYYKMPALCIGQPYTDALKINDNKDAISQIDKAKIKYVANILINALE